MDWNVWKVYWKLEWTVTAGTNGKRVIFVIVLSIFTFVLPVVFGHFSCNANFIVYNIRTLINGNVERGNGFSENLKNQKSVTIYVQCRQNYTRKCIIAAVKRQYEEEHG